MRLSLTTLTAAAGLICGLASAALGQSGGPYNLTWNTIDGGGGTSTGGVYSLSGTIGQADAGSHAGGAFLCQGGFWNGGAGPCYANCDGSTTVPILNINDFVCFQQRFAAGDGYANCDGSTTAPILNVNDFICFQQRYAAGCP